MKRSLRVALAESHVAAVAIAVLLLWSLDGAFRALWDPALSAARFLFTAVAIFDIPYFSPTFTMVDQLMLVTTLSYSAIVSFSAAWLLSRWVYGAGPLRTLTSYRSQLTGRHDV